MSVEGVLGKVPKVRKRKKSFRKKKNRTPTKEVPRPKRLKSFNINLIPTLEGESARFGMGTVREQIEYQSVTQSRKDNLITSIPLSASQLTSSPSKLASLIMSLKEIEDDMNENDEMNDEMASQATNRTMRS